MKGDSTWRLAGLPATGPAPRLRGKMRLFGQFVGSWDITERRVPGFRGSTGTGEVHFNWILDGRAIQDVWGMIDPATQRLVPVGTTIRYYDPSLRAWRSTWLSPLQGVVRRFIGRKVGDEIVLKEENRGRRTERWIFADIRPDSFRWYAVRRLRARGEWRTIEEMILRRRAAT